MLKDIPITKNTYEKQGSKWVLTETENKKVTEEYIDNIISAKKFFQNLGGYEKHEKNYTNYGFRIIRVISINPSRDIKIVYEFDFDDKNIHI